MIRRAHSFSWSDHVAKEKLLTLTTDNSRNNRWDYGGRPVSQRGLLSFCWIQSYCICGEGVIIRAYLSFQYDICCKADAILVIFSLGAYFIYPSLPPSHILVCFKFLSHPSLLCSCWTREWMNKMYVGQRLCRTALLEGSPYSWQLSHTHTHTYTAHHTDTHTYCFGVIR